MRIKNKKKNYLLPAALIGILNLALLLYLKYFLNGLTSKQLRFDYFGNIIAFFISAAFIIGILVLRYSNKNVDPNRALFILSLQILYTLSLLLILIINKSDLLDSGGFLFHFPLKKVYVGFLFVFGGIISIYTPIFIWGLIIGPENLYEIRALVKTAVVILLFLVLSLSYVWNVRAFDENKLNGKKYEFGCIPGAAVYSKNKPSPIFEARIRKAFELYQKGTIKNIILTGGSAPGETSESEAAHRYLKNLDVPDKYIRLENQSSTTTLQIKYLFEEIVKSENQEPVLIVSDGFHLTRINEIAKFFDIKVVGVASDYSMSFDKAIFYRTRESVALLLFWFFAV